MFYTVPLIIMIEYDINIVTKPTYTKIKPTSLVFILFIFYDKSRFVLVVVLQSVSLSVYLSLWVALARVHAHVCGRKYVCV